MVAKIGWHWREDDLQKDVSMAQGVVGCVGGGKYAQLIGEDVKKNEA